jgi:preprotein translocase subunit YajC
VTHASLLLLLIAPREGANGALVFAVQMAAVAAIFYFIMIRPQKKEQERFRAMLDALKKGDEVITAGGIIGTVVHAEADRVTIKTAESTRIVVERARIAKVTSAKTTTEA